MSQRIVARFYLKLDQREELLKLLINLSSLGKIIIRRVVENLVVIFEVKKNPQNSRRNIIQNGANFDKVFETFGHLLSFDIHVPSVQPVVDPLAVLRKGLGLGNLVIMMRKLEILPSRVDVHPPRDGMRAHHRALYVPPGPSQTPGRLVLGLVFL